MNLYLLNLGCAKNQVDGELLAGYASRSGIHLTEDPYSADVVVINTCAFIQEAKEETIEVILEAARLKAENRCQRLFVCGCFPQRYKDQLPAKLPEVDAFFGVNQWQDLLRTLIQRDFKTDANPYLRRHLWTPRHYAYLRIADGCDRGCSFCVIPTLRGPYHSRSPDDIIEEAQHLAQQGVKELFPVAQELNSYGHDLGLGERNRPLISLLEKLCTIDGIEWIRPLYLHPPACDEELLSFWASQPKLCKYLDLPIEHASDRILKAMGRGSSQERIRDLIATARRLIADVVIRTSVIIGFPGESNAEFEELLDFIQEIRFERLGSFRFSPEKGTPAFDLPDQVPDELKADRQEKLMTIQSEISLQQNLAQVGCTREVFIDSYEEESGYSIAHSQRELPELDGEILIKGHYSPGTKMRVKIETATEYDLFAQPLENEMNNQKVPQTFSQEYL